MKFQLSVLALTVCSLVGCGKDNSSNQESGIAQNVRAMENRVFSMGTCQFAVKYNDAASKATLENKNMSCWNYSPVGLSYTCDKATAQCVSETVEYNSEKKTKKHYRLTILSGSAISLETVVTHSETGLVLSVSSWDIK